jgi:hypothetical protein
MCDFTSDAVALQTPLIPGKQFFEKKWLDVFPANDNLDINEWVDKNSTPQSDLILQMDIEGAEYRNLLNVRDEILKRFRIIVIEVHGLSDLNRASYIHGIFNPVFTKISKFFTCVHAHPNNSCGFTEFEGGLRVPNAIELTFLRTDRIKKSDLPLVLPHELDISNINSYPPLLLSGIWLKNSNSLFSAINGLIKRVDWLESNFCDPLRLIQVMKRESDRHEQLLVDCLDSRSLPLLNVALNKKATQSSISEYSTANDANGAINGVKTGKFGFHTDFEFSPWWMVDLDGVFEVSEVHLYNRLDAAHERINCLEIYISIDGNSWKLVYEHAGSPPFGGIVAYKGKPKLIVPLDNLACRFLKIQLKRVAEKKPLHLDQVEIYTPHRNVEA